MADAYQTSTSLDFVQAAYNRKAYFALRPELMYDSMADVFATEIAMPGKSVTFVIQGDLPVASTPLSETADVAAVATSDTTVTVTLAEYGNATVRTLLLIEEAFVEYDPVLADVVGFNAGVSID